MIFFSARLPFLTSLENQVLKPLGTYTQKKVAIIAMVIFSAIASFYLLSQFYYRARHKVNTFSDAENDSIKTSIFSPNFNKIDKQESTPIQSSQKSTWKEITPLFPNRKEAADLVSRNTKEDPLLDVFSSFDYQVRMKSKTPVSAEEFLPFYLDQIQECTKQEQSKIRKYLESLNQKLKNYGIQLPTEINFIKTSGKEEIPGTAAYCRYETIIFNYMSEHLLAHELFHIYSRCHPEMRKKLYALIGYHVIPPLEIPDQLKANRILNPDLLYFDAYINIKYQGNTVQAVPIDLYDLTYQGPGKSKYFEGIYHKFAMLEQQANGEFQFKLDDNHSPILFNFEEAENLQEQIGKNTSYVDSPEEILADNFAMMLMGQSGNSPDLIEKMKRCFKNSNENLLI